MSVYPQRLGPQVGPFDAKLARVGRVRCAALDADHIRFPGLRGYAATHPTIRASGFNRLPHLAPHSYLVHTKRKSIPL